MLCLLLLFFVKVDDGHQVRHVLAHSFPSRRSSDRRLAVFAVISPERLGGDFAEFPTFKEQGYDVVNETWRGIFGPPGMPEHAVIYWRYSLAEMVQTEIGRAHV